MEPTIQTEARPGAVTFLPAEPRPQRAVVGLLSALVVLLALLVVGLAGTDWYAYQQYRLVQATVEREARDARAQLGGDQRSLARQLTGAAATGRELLAELEGRQQRLGAGLQATTGVTMAQVHALEVRRAALSPIPASPFGKLDQMIRLNQLLADEQLLLLRHTAAVTAIAGANARPTAAERHLARPHR